MAQDKNKQLVYGLIETIAQSIAGPNSHGHQKHHVRGKEFTDERLGPPIDIQEPDDLVRHAYRVLTDPETRIINTVDKRYYAYHPPTNTICIVNPANNDADGGTMYRLDPKTDGRGPEWHSHITASDAAKCGVAAFTDQPGGLVKALLRDMARAVDMRKAYDHRFHLHQEIRKQPARNDKPPTRVKNKNSRHRH